MYCTYMLTIASLKMFLRSRQALFFSLFMPLIILFIFGSMDFDSPDKMDIGVVTHTASPQTTLLLKELRSVNAFSIETGTLDSELAQLKHGNRTVVIDVPDDLFSSMVAGKPSQLNVYVNAGQPVQAQMAVSILNQFADRASLYIAHVSPLFSIQQQTLSAHNFRYIEFLLPGVIAMAIMQMSVFSVAFVFTRYRELGILKRLMATPMRPYQFVTANIITRLFMALAQAAIFIALGMVEFHVHIAGAFWLLTVCITLGALMFLGLGFTISGLCKTIETVPVLANIVVFPMLFLGNVFFPNSSMPPWLSSIAGYLPLTFFSNALHGVMTNGAGLLDIKWELTGMIVWAIVLISLAVYAFRFQEKQSA